MPDRLFFTFLLVMAVLTAVAVVVGGSLSYVLATVSLLVWVAAFLLDLNWGRQ